VPFAETHLGTRANKGIFAPNLAETIQLWTNPLFNLERSFIGLVRLQDVLKIAPLGIQTS
jgi:hypothetical protein